MDFFALNGLTCQNIFTPASTAADAREPNLTSETFRELEHSGWMKHSGFCDPAGFTLVRCGARRKRVGISMSVRRTLALFWIAGC